VFVFVLKERKRRKIEEGGEKGKRRERQR